jgi:hypothetical protein
MKVKLKAELISGTGNPVIFVNDVESVVFDNEKIYIVAKDGEHNLSLCTFKSVEVTEQGGKKMTDKDALACIEDVLSSTVRYDESFEYELTSYDVDWLEKAKDAVEKQIPKKPVEVRNEIVCPTCKTLVGSSPYCRYCGQALDWSDTE